MPHRKGEGKGKGRKAGRLGNGSKRISKLIGSRGIALYIYIFWKTCASRCLIVFNKDHPGDPKLRWSCQLQAIALNYGIMLEITSNLGLLFTLCTNRVSTFPCSGSCRRTIIVYMCRNGFPTDKKSFVDKIVYTFWICIYMRIYCSFTRVRNFKYFKFLLCPRVQWIVENIVRKEKMLL